MPPKGTRAHPKSSVRLKRDVQNVLTATRPQLDHSGSDVCGACLLSVSEDSQVGLIDSCRHSFHYDCIHKWSNNENTCPQCKLRFSWLACYSCDGKRTSLERIKKRNQEVSEDDDCEDELICEVCKEVGDESSLLLCDGMHGTCNAAFHYACVGLQGVPDGSWFCKDCIDKRLDFDAEGYGNSDFDISRSSDQDEFTFVSSETRKRFAQQEMGTFPSKKPRSFDSGISPSWRCLDCTLENTGNQECCAACGCPKQDMFSRGANESDPVLGIPWSCSKCTLANDAIIKFCVACGTQRALAVASTIEEVGSPLAKSTAHWNCSACTLENIASDVSCKVCGTLRIEKSAAPAEDIAPQSNERNRTSFASGLDFDNNQSSRSCPICTFVNGPVGENCAVCGSMLSSGAQDITTQNDGAGIVIEVED